MIRLRLARLRSRLGLVFLCAVAACGDGGRSAAPVGAPAPEPITYARELATLTAAIEDGARLAERQPENALVALETVALYVERARLTGDYDDFGRAGSLLGATTARMDPHSYPCLPRARLDFTLHRLDAARVALDACPAAVDATEIAGLRGDVALYGGRYREAESTYRALVNQLGTPQQYIRLAHLRSKTGAPGEAAALLEAAERRYHGVSATMKAWLKLQRGILALDRGRFDEALAMYRAAADALPGWWLVDEHVAEVKRLGGDAATAKTIYRDVVERTAAPELMDALAQIEAAEGRGEEAARLRQRARAIHEARLRAFPDAAAGHALEHFLRDGSDPARALELGERNFAARPYGDAAVAWARALLQVGEARRAAELLEAQVAAGWDTAEIHWVLGEAQARLGRREAAAQAERAALARNPASAAMYATAAAR